MSGPSPQGSSHRSGHMDNCIPVIELVMKKKQQQQRKKNTWPQSDSQDIRFLWTDMAANSTEEPFLPQTATGGQAHARRSRGCQMSPDKSQGQSKAPISAQGALCPLFFSP